MRDELIEIVRRALCQNASVSASSNYGKMLGKSAAAALAAIEAAGWAVVPKSPTEEIINAMFDCDHSGSPGEYFSAVYYAAIDASRVSLSSPTPDGV